MQRQDEFVHVAHLFLERGRLYVHLVPRKMPLLRVENSNGNTRSKRFQKGFEVSTSNSWTHEKVLELNDSFTYELKPNVSLSRMLPVRLKPELSYQSQAKNIKSSSNLAVFPQENPSLQNHPLANSNRCWDSGFLGISICTQLSTVQRQRNT